MLTGLQREELEKAMMDAFPEIIYLEMMFDYRLQDILGKRFNQIREGNSLQQVTFNLIKKADSEDWLQELVTKAHERNPGNKKLKEFYEKFIGSDQNPEIVEVSLSVVIENAIETLQSKPQRQTPSADPVIIALETEGHSLADVLLPFERHLTIYLTESDINQLKVLREQIITLLQEPERNSWNLCKGSLKDLGDCVYSILTNAQPRLADIVQWDVDFDKPQPFAWVATPELLQIIELALTVITIPDSNQPFPFLSLQGADTYFLPLSNKANFHYRLPVRLERKLFCNLIQPGINLPHPQEGVTWKALEKTAPLNQICSSEIICSHGYFAEEISKSVIQGIRTQSDTSPTRIFINLGSGKTLESTIVEEILPLLPAFVGYIQAYENSSFNSPVICRSIISELVRGLEIQSLPCILGALKRHFLAENSCELIQRQEHSVQLFFLSCWTRIGRPLFSKRYPELSSPACPHLLELRTIASEGWYYDRTSDIPKQYRTATLSSLSKMCSSENCFHLYLTGEGGSGKSCFLRHIYNNLITSPDILSIWYRLDAPSSDWSNIEEKIKQLLQQAPAIQNQPEIQKILSQYRAAALCYLLPNLVKALRKNSPNFQIVLFIDQLERAFESGEKPELARLKKIAQAVSELLQEIGSDRGIRVFLASRKQYLPDFAGSSLDLNEMNLQFYVLSNVSDTIEQQSFIKKILKWCLSKNLISQDVAISDEAALEIAENAKGLPLDMVLSLIHLLSIHESGIIDKALVDRVKPWSKLFEEDLKSFRIDPVDWHIMLAMAHAKTEIVDINQVWWRLRLVSSDLTKLVQELKLKGIIEKLWLSGKLGRTIYGRPDQQGNISYLEFFHANMRDYLLINEYAHMPIAWRALDRLADAAQEWEQNHRYLSREDTYALMENKEVLLEVLQPKKEKEKESLLFVRELEDKRTMLVDAAKQCLCVSAITHKCYGSWLIQEIYQTPKDRAKKVVGWLYFYPESIQSLFIEFLIEENNDDARQALLKLILRRSSEVNENIPENIPEAIANVLSSPIYSRHYRIPLITLALEEHSKLLRVDKEHKKLQIPPDLTKFIAMVAEYNPQEIQDILSECALHLKTSLSDSNQRLSNYIESNRELPLNILQTIPPETRRARKRLEDIMIPKEFEPPMKLLLGENLISHFSQEEIEGWLDAIKETWGIPLPPCLVVEGKKEGLSINELRFYINGLRAANTEVYPDRELVLEKHWDDLYSEPPSGYLPGRDPKLYMDAYWIVPEYRQKAGVELYKTAKEVVRYWYEEMMRKNIHDIFDQIMLREFLLMTYGNNSIETREIFQIISPADLRRIIVNLIHECVYLRSLQRACMDSLRDFVRFSKEPDILSERLRAFFARKICTTFATYSQGMLGITLHSNIESALDDSCQRTELGMMFLLNPEQVRDLIEEIRDAVYRVWNQWNYLPVILCSPRIRLPLYQLMERHIPQIIIISYSELIPDINVEVAENIGEFIGSFNVPKPKSKNADS
jgi:GTPase SAR1 family protein